MRDIEKLKQYKKIYNARPEVKEKKKNGVNCTILDRKLKKNT